MVAISIPARLRSLLSEKEAAEYLELQRRDLDRRWPKPEDGEVEEVYHEGRSDFAVLHQKIRDNRERINLEKPLPQQISRHLVTNVRYHSRWSRNEVNRTTAAQTKNPPRFKVLPVGTDNAARQRAQVQERYLEARYNTIDRQQYSVLPLAQRIAHNQNQDGLGAMELYLTEAWHELDEEGFFEPWKEGSGESQTEHRRRLRELQMRIGIPWAWRQVDPLAMSWRAEEGSLSRVVIAEEKPWRVVYNSFRDRFGEDEAEERMKPLVGMYGHPLDSNSRIGRTPVLTKRYYDPRWYAYEIEGHDMEIAEHGLPGLPVGLCLGMPTGNPELESMMGGVTDGMGDQEFAVDVLMNLLLDRTIVFSQPRPVVELDSDADMPDDEYMEKGFRLTSTDIEEVKVLPPGWRVRDAWAGMRPVISEIVPLVQVIQQDFQRSGQNPIASGEAPGADTSGYTANLLTGSATTLYEPNLKEYARLWAWWGDFERGMIRDTFGTTAYVAAPGRGRKKNSLEWLALSPDSIDPTHCEVSIDPMNDSNRLALRSSLRTARMDGVISIEREREDGFGVTDHEGEEKLILQNRLRQNVLYPMAEEETRKTVGVIQESQAGGPMGGQPGLVDQFGNPMQQPTNRGAEPAPIDQPTVGAGAAYASRAGAASQRGGFGNGRVPPNALG